VGLISGDYCTSINYRLVVVTIGAEYGSAPHLYGSAPPYFLILGAEYGSAPPYFLILGAEYGSAPHYFLILGAEYGSAPHYFLILGAEYGSAPHYCLIEQFFVNKY